MHRLVPDFISKQYAVGQVSGRFSSVGLFVDISGFSTITDALMTHGQHGAEVLAVLMRAVFDPLVHGVYAQGGFIVTFAGDAFTALFPVDSAAEPVQGDVLAQARALAAAWHIQERMAALAQQQTPYGTFSVAAKVGVALGDVDWGIVMSEDGNRAAYYFRGTAVDECAAAEHLANAGEIVLTSDFCRAVQELVAAEAVAGHYRLNRITAALPKPGPVDLPPVDADIMALFYPRALVTQAHSGEFRHVVSMFISLPTVRTEAQLTLFMQSVFDLHNRYGGLLNRIDFGDKGSNVLLFWGAPVARENDIERALNFILDLQTRTSIPINAGVTYRIAHAGFVGSPLREEYTCFGRGVNLAARFMTSAARGEIWLDEGVARRAERQFDIAFEGAMAFKGFAKRQRVFVLYERKEELESPFQGELVGREAELAQLADFVAPLWEGRYAGVMVIWGEPGIGKSRLVHAFLTQTGYQVSESGQAFLAQTDEIDEILRASLNPFRYWMWNYFEQSEAQSESRNKRSFNRALDRLIDATEDEALAGELDRTRSFLGALVDLHWPDSLYEQLDPQGRYENTLIGLISLVQAESLRRPVVLHLEDAHWLDGDSKAFLVRLTRALTADERKAYPVALLVTARPGTSEPLLGEGLAYREIDLARLPRESLARLAQAQLGGPVAEALLELLAERAGGNPFFVEQILRYLQEGNFLAQNAEGWCMARGTPASLLPTDVRAVLVARLDQLAQEVKDVVQTAAVLGREFEVQLLDRMLREDEVLPRKVAEAERAAIWSALSQLRYLFKHALLRDTAYRMQVRARRRVLHQLAVEALESLFEAELAGHYGELAYHSEQAGLAEKARHYLRLAGDAAREAYQNSQAVDYYGRALKLVPENERETRWELLLAREKVNDLLGERDTQREDLQALEALAEQLDEDGKRAQVALRRSELALNTAAYDAAIAAAQQAVALAQAAEDLPMEAAGHRLWGGALRDHGAYVEARAQYEIARDQARAAGAKTVWARSLYELGAVAYYQTDYAGTQSYQDQALALYRELGDRRGEGLCLNGLATVTTNLGDSARARAYAEQASQVAQEVGDRQEGSRSFSILAVLAQREGNMVGAQSYYEQALQLFRQSGNRKWEALTLNNLGSVAWQRSDYAVAQTYLERALDIQRDIGNQWGESLCLENLGMVARDMGEHAQAQTYLEQGLAICRENGLHEREGIILNELGIVAASPPTLSDMMRPRRLTHRPWHCAVNWVKSTTWRRRWREWLK